MDITSLVKLKSKIDDFVYDRRGKGKRLVGIDALRNFVIDKYLKTFKKHGLRERYVKDQIMDLYMKLKNVEERGTLDKLWFNFTCSEDVTYHVFKTLNITYEDVMENNYDHSHAESEYEKLSEKMETINDSIKDLSDTIYFCNLKTERTNLMAKIIDFNTIFSSILYFSSRIKFVDLSGENKNAAERQFKMEILYGIMSLTNLFISYADIQKLLDKPIPLELMVMQYFRVYKESKKTLTDRVIEELGDNTKKAKYYDELAKKIESEIDDLIGKKPMSETSPTTEEERLAHYEACLNFYRYSCTVCLFDFINRIVISFTNSCYKNFSYLISKNCKISSKRILNLGSIPMYLQPVDTWPDYLEQILSQCNLSLQKNAVKANVDKLKDFLEKTASKLRQLAVYLEKINQREYSNEVVVEIKEIFEKYLGLIQGVIQYNGWLITKQQEKDMDKLNDALDKHTIIIAHGMGGVDDEV